MANENEQREPGPGTDTNSFIGLNEGAREGDASATADGQTEQVPGARGGYGGTSDGQTEQVSSGGSGTGTDNFGQDQRSSEGEPGRSHSDGTGGQTESETSDVPDPSQSDSRV